MKKGHIIGIVVIAVAIGAIMTTLSSSSTYASFTEAAKNPDDQFHVVGKQNKNKEMVYNPQENPDLFTFYMVDNEGVEKKVMLQKSKPQDFEHSEQIVIIGKCNGNDFVANDILMKCPSKYNDGKPEESSEKKVDS